MAIAFKKAVKAESKLRMALAGPSGSGKTFSALKIATALSELEGPGAGGVAVIDTERGSASKYSDIFNFAVLELESFHPDRYIEAIEAAQAGGFYVLVIDSITHEWRGKDGILEQIDQIVRRDKCSGIQAWGKATPMHNRFIDAMLTANMHVIVTMRSKMGVSVDKDDRGKTTVQKVGMEAEQRDGIEYEFDVAGDLDRDNTLVISKSRCSTLAGQIIRKPGTDLANTLAEWLHGAPAPQLRAVPTPPPAAEVERAAAAASVPPDRVSRALTDLAVLELLNKMNRRDVGDQRIEVEAVITAIERDGGTVNLKAIKAGLQRRIDQAAELSTLDTGSIGA